jgi:hypothetical protein
LKFENSNSNLNFKFKIKMDELEGNVPVLPPRSLLLLRFEELEIVANSATRRRGNDDVINEACVCLLNGYREYRVRMMGDGRGTGGLK